MKKILLIILCILAPLTSYAHRNQGFELRNNITFEIPMNEKVTFSTELTSRFKEHPFRVYYYEAELDLTFELPQDWEFAIGHQIQYEKNDDNRWIHEPTPLIFLKKTFKFEQFKLSNRFRGEYCLNGREWTYRNRTEIKITRFKINPYAYEEFYITEGKGYDENRLLVGLYGELCPKLKWQAGYIYLLEKSNSHWDLFHVFDWHLIFSF